MFNSPLRQFNSKIEIFSHIASNYDREVQYLYLVRKAQIIKTNRFLKIILKIFLSWHSLFCIHSVYNMSYTFHRHVTYKFKLFAKKSGILRSFHVNEKLCNLDSDQDSHFENICRKNVYEQHSWREKKCCKIEKCQGFKNFKFYGDVDFSKSVRLVWVNNQASNLICTTKYCRLKEAALHSKMVCVKDLTSTL